MIVERSAGSAACSEIASRIGSSTSSTTVVVVDLGDDPSRDHALLAEDPEAGVDDQVVPTSLGRGLVDLAEGVRDGDHAAVHERIAMHLHVSPCKVRRMEAQMVFNEGRDVEITVIVTRAFPIDQRIPAALCGLGQQPRLQLFLQKAIG